MTFVSYGFDGGKKSLLGCSNMSRIWDVAWLIHWAGTGWANSGAVHIIQHRNFVSSVRILGTSITLKVDIQTGCGYGTLTWLHASSKRSFSFMRHQYSIIDIPRLCRFQADLPSSRDPNLEAERISDYRCPSHRSNLHILPNSL